MSPTDADDDLQLDDVAVELAFPPSEWELPLRKAISLHDVLVTSLQLREPTSGEWELIFSKPADLRRRFAISLIAGVPMKDCADIGIGDLVRGENYLNAFFEVGQAIRGW